MGTALISNAAHAGVEGPKAKRCQKAIFIGDGSCCDRQCGENPHRIVRWESLICKRTQSWRRGHLSRCRPCRYCFGRYAGGGDGTRHWCRSGPGPCSPGYFICRTPKHYNLQLSEQSVCLRHEVGHARRSEYYAGPEGLHGGWWNGGYVKRTILQHNAAKWAATRARQDV